LYQVFDLNRLNIIKQKEDNKVIKTIRDEEADNGQVSEEHNGENGNDGPHVI
jgi:hypothetical protein